MAWDIYGNDLRDGYCEVHPHIGQEYPCHICMVERQQQNNYYQPQQQYYMTPTEAREKVISSFDLHEAVSVIQEAAEKGKLEHKFKHPEAYQFINGLMALGYKVSKTNYPDEIIICWI